MIKTMVELWKEELGNILRTSIDRASPIAKKYYASKPMSLDELLWHFDKVMTASVATVKPSGAPHVVTVSFVNHRGRLYINTSKRSARYRNTLHESRVAMSFIDGSKIVLLEGIARIAGETSKFTGGKVDQAFIRKYGRARRVTPYSVMVEVKPAKIFSYKGRE